MEGVHGGRPDNSGGCKIQVPNFRVPSFLASPAEQEAVARGRLRLRIRNGLHLCCTTKWGYARLEVQLLQRRTRFITERPGPTEDLGGNFLTTLRLFHLTPKTPLSLAISQLRSLLCTMGRILQRERLSGELAPVRDLLPGVWGLSRTAPSHRLEAYREHWKESVSSVEDADLLLALASQRNVTELIGIVKGNSQGSVEDVETAITGANLNALENGSDPVSVSAALRFAMRLWLFTEPDLSNKSLTLGQLVGQRLPKIASPTPLAHPNSLSDDFSAKSLTRKGGFRLVWTSYLSQHLTFEGTSRLRVFRHAAALRQYANSNSKER